MLPKHVLRALLAIQPSVCEFPLFSPSPPRIVFSFKYWTLLYA